MVASKRQEEANLAMFQDNRFSQAVLSLIAAEHCGGS
jgi:hypothetical protein